MNKDTIAAMQEAEHIAHNPSVKGYSNVDDLFEDLEENEDGLYFYMDDSVVIPDSPIVITEEMKKWYEEIDAYIKQKYAYLFVEE